MLDLVVTRNRLVDRVGSADHFGPVDWFQPTSRRHRNRRPNPSVRSVSVHACRLPEVARIVVELRRRSRWIYGQTVTGSATRVAAARRLAPPLATRHARFAAKPLYNE